MDVIFEFIHSQMKAHNHNEPIPVVELAHKVEFTHEVELTLMVKITTGDVSATLTVYNNVTVNGLQVTHCNELHS